MRLPWPSTRGWGDHQQGGVEAGFPPVECDRVFPGPLRAGSAGPPGERGGLTLAGRIRDEDIVLVRERAAIADVVGESVQLKGAGGGRLKGLCPFHDEKSPSFNVNPALGMYHCLAGETRVLTDEGVIPIRELAGKTARILTSGERGHASWVEAPFHSFGVQPLLKLTLSRNGRIKELFATDEHRWFVKSGGQRQSRSERLTKNLRPGDRLVSAFPHTRVKH